MTQEQQGQDAASNQPRRDIDLKEHAVVAGGRAIGARILKRLINGLASPRRLSRDKLSTDPFLASDLSRRPLPAQNIDRDFPPLLRTKPRARPPADSPFASEPITFSMSVSSLKR